MPPQALKDPIKMIEKTPLALRYVELSFMF
jgi:hypothetical protein